MKKVILLAIAGYVLRRYQARQLAKTMPDAMP
jgi:hypothetical protein